MPAGRACARCGATLSPDVRWCLACYEPVREYTPRAPIAGATATRATPAVRLSRRGGGDLGLGLGTRVTLSILYLALTVALAAFTFTGSDGLIAFMVPVVLVPWLVAGIWVGRDLWKAVPQQEGPTTIRKPRTPRLPSTTARERMLAGIGLVVAGVVVLAYSVATDDTKGAIVMITVIAGLVLSLNWARKGD